jgi:hypothetical protein
MLFQFGSSSNFLVGVIGLTILSASTYAQDMTLSPLKQVQEGVAPQDVKCSQDLKLVINQFNSEPACTNQSHVARLLSVGWITQEKFVTLHPFINQTKIGTISQRVTANNEISNTNLLNLKKIINSNIPNNATNAINSIQLPNSISLPTISSSEPVSVKLLSIGMFPNLLKIGDFLQINATFQNISGNSFYINGGCRDTTLFSSITPASNVQEYPRNKIMCADWQKEIQPNEIFTTIAHSKLLNGEYQIIKPGMLNVTLAQVTTDQKPGWRTVETISFTVNATQ